MTYSGTVIIRCTLVRNKRSGYPKTTPGEENECGQRAVLTVWYRGKIRTDDDAIIKPR